MHLWTTPGEWRRIARRAIARTILDRYVGVGAAALEFGRDGDGRPELLTPAPAGRIRFSTGSAPGLLVLAVAAEPVGVDVEPRRRRVCVEGLIEAVCTESEREQLGSRMEPAARDEAFIWCWTGKEACAKASGLGLAAPFEEIEVGTGPVGGVRAVAPAASHPAGPWLLYRAGVLADYAVAVAVA